MRAGRPEFTAEARSRREHPGLRPEGADLAENRGFPETSCSGKTPNSASSAIDPGGCSALDTHSRLLNSIADTLRLRASAVNTTCFSAQTPRHLRASAVNFRCFA